ncbi:peptidase U32 [Ruminiclostridium papyrosolvens DSM 2782]|uniref:Peptidase U32 n=1 Tax=Ruminiclostridium papyrosolvens DSM 2782 TaxID=588581 RepID=F1TCY5_9FIRM|nr:U32 family peptidase [Ruminiclostridium papyrosolvens]EGD47852.1 peptidase U32 [Ruminiclostridium papyrosolvens DSM 2782]WES34566.1 DUF3656 domain-containing protein [Ruminiclostridium papyrosolvens DSM 2782]
MAKKIELLAPAGTYDAFLAAIENGADAVYLGGKLLNARQFAGNFDEEQLEKALDYAHTRDASIFLTMNTLVLDSEMQEAVEYAAKAYEMGVDAFIVQDMGLAANLKKLIPEITLHASTQMTIYSMEGIKALEALGFDRIVLARELNLEEIKRICGQTSLEIEAFVHGALCICVSGQCYMSSMIGGRSGNRGKCAQPCRMPYSIKKDGSDLGSGYLISPKDICYIDHLYELVDGGVTSLKIEGRMKSPEYVASVVGTYRKYLDLVYETKDITDSKIGRHKASQEDRHKLLQSFNRGGFSKGYLLGKTGPEMMAYEKPKNWGTPLGSVVLQDKSANSVLLTLENTLGMGDGIEIWSGSKFQESPGGIITKIVKDKRLVRKAQKGDTVWVSVIKGNVQKGSRVYKTSDKEMLEQAAATYSKGNRKSIIRANFTMKYGQVPVLNLQDAYGNSVSASGEQFPQKAVNKPLTKERILEQLKKMGSTPFDIADINLDIDEDAVIPISELNNIRRSAAEQLEQKRILSFKKEAANFDKRTFNLNSYFPGNVKKINRDKKISAIFYDYPYGMDFKDLDVDRVYLPFTEIMGNEGLKSIHQTEKEVYAYIPAVIRGNYTDILKKNLQKVSEFVDGFLAGSPAAYEIIREKLGNKVPVIGDFTINIINSYSLNKLKELGFTGGTISCELNMPQITQMKYPENFDTELVVYGKVPVMTSEYCPVGGSVGKCEPRKCGNLCKNGVYKLSDRKGAEFLVKSDCIDCRSTIFNSNVLFAPELSEQISKTGIEHIRLSFVDETEKDIRDICSLYGSLLGHDKITPYMEKLIERIKASGFTRGHFQKGV